MKNIIFAALVLVAVPAVVFGATIIRKEYSNSDYISRIDLSNQSNVKVYKVDDPTDPKVKCYVSVFTPTTVFVGESRAATSRVVEGTVTSNLSCVKI